MGLGMVHSGCDDSSIGRSVPKPSTLTGAGHVILRSARARPNQHQKQHPDPCTRATILGPIHFIE